MKSFTTPVELVLAEPHASIKLSFSDWLVYDIDAQQMGYDSNGKNTVNGKCKVLCALDTRPVEIVDSRMTSADWIYITRTTQIMPVHEWEDYHTVNGVYNGLERGEIKRVLYSNAPLEFTDPDSPYDPRTGKGYCPWMTCTIVPETVQEYVDTWNRGQEIPVYAYHVIDPQRDTVYATSDDLHESDWDILYEMYTKWCHEGGQSRIDQWKDVDVFEWTQEHPDGAKALEKFYHIRRTHSAGHPTLQWTRDIEPVKECAHFDEVLETVAAFRQQFIDHGVVTDGQLKDWVREWINRKHV